MYEKFATLLKDGWQWQPLPDKKKTRDQLRPLNLSEDPPKAPDRPEVTPFKGSVRLKWETRIGANEYKVYRREKGNQNWAAIYSGRSQGFVDKNAKKATAKFSRPGYKAGANSDMKGIVIYEYCITASDKNGESPKSEITNTDPRNW